jgi:hypothetical protein
VEQVRFAADGQADMVAYGAEAVSLGDTWVDEAAGGLFYTKLTSGTLSAGLPAGDEAEVQAMQTLRIVTPRGWHTARQKMESLNDGRLPNFRGVRVEGNRRASRNGLESDLPPEITSSRFAT